VLDARGALRSRVPPELPVYELGQLRTRRAIPAMAGFIRRHRPRLVFSSFPHITIALELLGQVQRMPPLIAREANLPSLSLVGTGMALLLRQGCRFAYPRCALVVASSKRMRHELMTSFGVVKERILLLPNPVDVERIRADMTAAVTQYFEIGGPAGRRLFVASGRLVEQKGFDRLVASWRTLPDEYHLVVLGEGPQQQQLESMLSDKRLAGRVRLHGYTDNPWVWYGRADALLMPSRFEGMPNAALEALACGTPVVATPEAGGLSELAAEVPRHGLAIAEFEADFRQAIVAMPRRPDGGVRPSLLPDAHRAATVAGVLRDRLRRVLQ
jgi:glycosyltransferase involved in cell wall biosynthesis